MNHDDPAFPQVTKITSGQEFLGSLGLTKRELFATMAMQGILSCNSVVQDTAGWAVKYADALIKELNKEKAK